MAGIDAVSNIPGGANPTTQTNTPSGQIDQEGFLKLLVAQLQNQDPLEPLTNEEFVQQLTSFSSLDELRGINGGLDGLEQLGDISELLGASLALQQTNLNAMTVSLIGKEVEADTDTVIVGEDVDAQIAFDLPAGGTTEVTVRLTGASGNVIYENTFNPSNPPDGITVNGNEVVMDIPTEDSAGNPLATGAAKVTVEAAGATGRVPLPTSLRGVVGGIDFRGETTLITLGGVPVDLADILAINHAG